MPELLAFPGGELHQWCHAGGGWRQHASAVACCAGCPYCNSPAPSCSRSRPAPIQVSSGRDWRHIELEARKFLLVARSSVTVEAQSAEQATSQLVDVAGQRALAVPASGAWRIDARSSAPGANSHVTVWLARDNLQLLQRERLDSIQGGRYKLTRILEDGSYGWQRRAAPARGTAPRDWPLKRERLHRAVRTGDCTDSLGLLLLSADLVRSERVRSLARVCTDEGALDVALTLQGDARQRIAHTRVRSVACAHGSSPKPCVDGWVWRSRTVHRTPTISGCWD